MQAVRIHDYNQPLKYEQVPDPKITNPYDVIIKVAGAGVCRTDLHIIESIWKESLGDPTLPFIIGHENSGWVQDKGEAITNLSIGDPVILHPLISCGICRACREGNDMHCVAGKFPGLDGTDGGYAQYMKTSARSVVKLEPGVDPISLAPFADAGITAYHAVKKIIPLTYPGSVAVVIGLGGLGHFAVQLLKQMTTAKVVVVDSSSQRGDFARELGADLFISSNPVKELLDYTHGQGADVVLDFVGEKDTPKQGIEMTRKGGTYSIIGYGGNVSPTTLEMISREINIVGNLVGTYNDLVELMELYHQGKVHITSQQFPLKDAQEVLDKLNNGQILGRAVLKPW